MGKSRVLLKLSGEVLKGSSDQLINPDICRALSTAVASLVDSGVQLGIVIGGGNLFRGSQEAALGMPRTPADHMGMLATIMNGIALKHYFESTGYKTHVMSGLECPKAVESYIWHKAMDALDQGDVVIFVGGTGSPYFTTDTAAALRASEIQAGMLLKATKVDGIYTEDPIKHPDAKRYGKVTFDQVLEEDLKVMDAAAFALCRNNRIPILIFNMDHLLSGKPVDLEQLKKLGSLIYAND